MKILSRTPPASDGSRKYIVELSDRRRVEAVYLPDSRSYGICVSTQVGCNMGCRFCATAQQRVERNLTADEIASQAMLVSADVDDPLPLSFVTLAGMGEPLANYSNSIAALESIRTEMAASTLSLSTIGFPERLQQLANEKRGFRIYLSLHAPTDSLRARLIPMAAHYRVADLIDAMSLYGEINGADHARISYLLLKDVNDGETYLKRLCSLLKGRPVMVQLLFWNEVKGVSFERVSDQVAEHWREVLISHGIKAYKMPSLGQSIGAACGQLSTAIAS